MKKITASLMLVVFGACKKGYLDRLPSDYINEKEVFSNINNAEAFLNNIYNTLPNYTYGMAGPLSSATDEGMQGVDWSLSTADGNTFNKGAYSPGNFPFMDLWKQYYDRIRACNIFLENYALVPEDPNYPGRRERMRGEALLLRGYYYFELLHKWGGVPLVSSRLNPFDDPDGVFYNRGSITETVNFIVKDLDEAATLLPYEYYQRSNNWGRASAMVALAVKSRLLLYYASPLYSDETGTARWVAAAEAGKKAIEAANANGYTLHDNYSDVFLQYFNREVIWSRPMGDAGVIERESNPRGANGYAHSMPLQELIEDYEMQLTGKIPSEAGSGFDAKHPFLGRDPRFYASILYPGARWKGRLLSPTGADAPAVGELGTNYWQRKGCVESVNLFDNTGFIDRKFVLFRTAELYLNYAEALNESAGPVTEVHDAVNAVRRRSRMPDLPDNLTQTEMRERIRRERRIELAFERHRFWDVRRWKIAEVVDKGPVHKVAITVNGTDTTYSYPVVQTRVFDATRHYWMPIPQAEIDKAGKKAVNFKQNPGW